MTDSETRRLECLKMAVKCYELKIQRHEALTVQEKTKPVFELADIFLRYVRYGVDEEE